MPSLLALLAMTLAGCSATTPRSRPAPVSEVVGMPRTRPSSTRPGSRKEATADGVRVYPYRARSAALAAPLATAATPWTDAPLPASQTPTTLASLHPPASAISPTASSSAPVQALLKQAEAQRAAGDLVSAAATLERGLRIEPRNPHLWNRLARIRLEQGLFAQADSLAAKSNTLADNLPTLVQDNRRIIAAARQKGGR